MKILFVFTGGTIGSEVEGKGNVAKNTDEAYGGGQTYEPCEDKERWGPSSL